jgi:hypothetical protein
MKITILNEASMPLYTAAVLKPEETALLQEKLLSLNIIPDGWLITKQNPFGMEMLNHHMTIHVKPAAKLPHIADILNKEIDLKIVGFGIDLEVGVAAWKVDTNILVKAATPHITAALKDTTVRPFLAGEIKEWQNIPPFSIKAIVSEVS